MFITFSKEAKIGNNSDAQQIGRFFKCGIFINNKIICPTAYYKMSKLLIHSNRDEPQKHCVK